MKDKYERWTKERIIEWVEEKRPSWELDIDSLPDKIRVMTRIKYLCKLCKYNNELTINNAVNNNRGCVRCAGKEHWTKIQLADWYVKNRPGWVLFDKDLPEELRMVTKIKSQCPRCAYINQQVLHSIVHDNNGCFKCKLSSGEELVDSILRKLFINFERELISSKIKSSTRYRFDFALMQYRIIIEFHGSQHYIPKTFGSKSLTKEEMHAEVCRNDKKKQEIVKAAGWYWLEIPYTLKNDLTTIERMIVEAIHYNNF